MATSTQLISCHLTATQLNATQNNATRRRDYTTSLITRNHPPSQSYHHSQQPSGDLRGTFGAEKIWQKDTVMGLLWLRFCRCVNAVIEEKRERLTAEFCSECDARIARLGAKLRHSVKRSKENIPIGRKIRHEGQDGYSRWRQYNVQYYITQTAHATQAQRHRRQQPYPHNHIPLNHNYATYMRPESGGPSLPHHHLPVVV